jgi:hypothetical protein
VKDPTNRNDPDYSSGDQGNGPDDVRRPPKPGDVALPALRKDKIILLRHFERQDGGRRPSRPEDPPPPSWVGEWISQTFDEILPE